MMYGHCFILFSVKINFMNDVTINAVLELINDEGFYYVGSSDVLR